MTPVSLSPLANEFASGQDRTVTIPASQRPRHDVAVLFGSERDYIRRHPGTALLVVEVAVSTATQDRLTKAAIYAEAGVMNYWIVQPVVGMIEVYSQVRPELRSYVPVSRVHSETELVLDGLENVAVRSQDLFPDRVFPYREV